MQNYRHTTDGPRNLEGASKPLAEGVGDDGPAQHGADLLNDVLGSFVMFTMVCFRTLLPRGRIPGSGLWAASRDSVRCRLHVHVVIK